MDCCSRFGIDRAGNYGERVGLALSCYDRDKQHGYYSQLAGVMQTIKCPDCQTEIEVPEVKLEVLNSEHSSLAIYHHARGVDCTGCGTYLIPFFAQVETQVGWKTHPKPKEASRLVLASPNGGRAWQ